MDAWLALLGALLLFLAIVVRAARAELILGAAVALSLALFWGDITAHIGN